ncbi:MAG: T9SS type A sorting domain-containing protein [Flavobacteriaceae bacterium]|nr:T9SS type A sorting domain-containing protein [Flavobacteriaceae bacterium]
MKKIYFLFLTSFLLSFTAVAQGIPCPGGGSPPCNPPNPSGETISFAYDNAGNQIKRYFATPKSANQIAEVTETLVEELEEKQEDISLLDYYPNPIENELTITWAKSINSYVSSIQIYSLNSKLIKNFNPSKNTQKYRMPFQNIAGGVYIIKVLFNDGKQDVFKVIKK